MTAVLPRFWHGEDVATWLIVEPTALKRLMQIEQAVYVWSKTVAVKQP